MNKVLRLPINKDGRDIIVGDIHGMWSDLKKALVTIKFNKNIDRLIIAGDLVDRGPNSEVSAKWIQEDWCFSVMGNHDAQFAFHDDYNKFSRSLVCMPADPWFVDLAEGGYEKFGDLFRKHLYPAIEIETAKGLVGVVHADVPKGLGWHEMTERLNNKDYDLLHECFWSRDTAKKAEVGMSIQDEMKYHLKDLCHVFHGHSPARSKDYKPYCVANRYFIDTAACKALKKEKYPYAGITLYDVRCPQEPIFKPYIENNEKSMGMDLT